MFPKRVNFKLTFVLLSKWIKTDQWSTCKWWFNSCIHNTCSQYVFLSCLRKNNWLTHFEFLHSIQMLHSHYEKQFLFKKKVLKKSVLDRALHRLNVATCMRIHNIQRNEINKIIEPLKFDSPVFQRIWLISDENLLTHCVRRSLTQSVCS